MKLFLKTSTFLLLLILFACSCNITGPDNDGFPTETKFVTSTKPANTETPVPSNEADDFQADLIINFEKEISQSPPFYGTNGWWTDQDAEIWKTRYAELNVNIVRLPVLQFILEPQNDNADPNTINWEKFGFDKPYEISGKSLTYHEWFSTLKELDMTIMLYIPYLANWLSKSPVENQMMSPYPPNNIEEYEEFIRALLVYLVDEINYPQDKIILEPINEADLLCGSDPAVSCFWENWSEEELLEVIQTAEDQAKSISDKIKIAGISTCCQHELLNLILEKNPNLINLDYLTFHYYENSDNFFLQKLNMNEFSNKGLPVIFNEYGNSAFWSNGKEAGIWHSLFLAKLWKEGISPIQYHIAEWPIMHDGYNELGLFKNWLEDWKIKPSYWVYVNFYSHLKDNILIESSFPENSYGIAGKNEDLKQITVWVINVDYGSSDLKFKLENFSFTETDIQVFNNLESNIPLETLSIDNENGDNYLEFSYPVESTASYCFILNYR